MPKYLHLQIPEPCNENWHHMNPTTQGRFCNSCKKTVTDFTQMSDTQLANFFKQPKASCCGRFTQEQLERDILIPKKKIPWVKYFFQFTLPAFLLTLKSTAQTIRVKAPVETRSITKGNAVKVINGATVALERTTIKGTVNDNENKPIPYASVFIEGTNKGVATDSAGNFVIEEGSLPCTLNVSSIGYDSKQVLLSAPQTEVNIQLVTKYLQGFLGGYIAVKSVRRKKEKKELKKETCIKPRTNNPTLTIYPNPLLSFTPLNLKWQNLEVGNYIIEVYSISGTLIQSQKILLEKDLKETSLSINQLLTGNYFVRLMNEKTGKQLSQQFIVQE